MKIRPGTTPLERGGATVRDGVLARLQQPWPDVDTDELALRAGVSAQELRASAKRGKTDVVAPALAALLKPSTRAPFAPEPACCSFTTPHDASSFSELRDGSDVA